MTASPPPLRQTPERMSNPVPPTELGKLAAVMPDLADGFRHIRREALKAGPLTNETVELIVVAGLAATHRLDALRVHITRLLDMGAERAAIAHALVACLGAATTLTETVDGLAVLAECLEEHPSYPEFSS